MSQDTVPTVRIKSGDSYAIINESDFDPSIHEDYDAPAEPDGSLAGGPIVIPPDWQSLHHHARISLAKSIAGVTQLVLAEGETTQTAAADRIIAAELAARTAATAAA